MYVNPDPDFTGMFLRQSLKRATEPFMECCGDWLVGSFGKSRKPVASEIGKISCIPDSLAICEDSRHGSSTAGNSCVVFSDSFAGKVEVTLIEESWGKTIASNGRRS